jgi:outer membrane protein assembly factor BamB
MRRGWAALLVLSLASCRTSTQITLEISTDVPCTQLGGVTVTVGHLDEIETKPPVTSTVACDANTGRVGALVVVPSGGRSDEIAIRVVAGLGRLAEGCTAPAYGPGCIVSRRSLHFVPHTELTLPIVMSGVCNGVVCDPHDTCVGGTCKPATVEDSSSCVGGGCSDHGLYGDSTPSLVDCGDMRGLQHGAAWPMVGYCPTARYRSPYVGTKSAKQRWVFDPGPGSTGKPRRPSDGAIGADGTYYFGTALANEGGQSMFALDGATGGKKWELAGDKNQNGPAIGVDGTLYFGDGTGEVRAVSPGGKQLWAADTGADGADAPTIGGDRTLYALFDTGQLSALAPDGSNPWNVTVGVAAGTSVTIGLDGALLVGVDQRLEGHDPKGGALLFGYDAAAPVGRPSVGADGTIYGVAAKPTTAGVTFALDAKTHALRWSASGGGRGNELALGPDGTIFISSFGVSALDPVSGAERWNVPLSGSTNPVADAAGVVFVGTDTGGGTTAGVYALDGKTGKILWSFPSPTGTLTYVRAIAADGTVIASDDSQVFAIGP